MIQNIIFDLGNVLLTFKPREFLLRFTNDNDRIDQFILNVTTSETWLKLDRGLLSLDNARKTFLKKFSQEKELINLFFNNWLEIFSPIEKNIKILKELKSNRYQIFALSNFIKEAYNYVIEKFEFFSLFNGQVISYKEKTVKPEKRIYEILLNRFNLIPNQCLFLDDYLIFLESAKKLGINTILIYPEIDLRKELWKFEINI
jgi:putative hydrolase of the HAD superfamily